MDDPITREVTVAAPPDVVWDALTDPAELADGSAPMQRWTSGWAARSGSDGPTGASAVAS